MLCLSGQSSLIMLKLPFWMANSVGVMCCKMSTAQFVGEAKIRCTTMPSLSGKVWSSLQNAQEAASFVAEGRLAVLGTAQMSCRYVIHNEFTRSCTASSCTLRNGLKLGTFKKSTQSVVYLFHTSWISTMCKQQPHCVWTVKVNSMMKRRPELQPHSINR